MCGLSKKKTRVSLVKYVKGQRKGWGKEGVGEREREKEEGREKRGEREKGVEIRREREGVTTEGEREGEGYIYIYIYSCLLSSRMTVADLT